MKIVGEYLKPGERRPLREFLRQPYKREERRHYDVDALARELHHELQQRDPKTVPFEIPLLVNLASKQPNKRGDHLARALAILKGRGP